MGNVTSTVISGLTPGTAYSFDVRAINAVGTGTVASAKSTSVSPTATVPGAPAIGAITAGNASATVRWTAPTNIGGSAITGYSVRAYTGTGTVVFSTTAVGNVTSTVITGLTNGTAYTFDVRAVNLVGTGASSARSGAVTPAAAGAVPSAPTIGTAASGVSTDTAITAAVPWTPALTGAAATGFVVIAQRVDTTTNALIGQPIQSAGLPATQRNFTMTLTTAGSYTFTVKATNAAGSSLASAVSNRVTAR